MLGSGGVGRLYTSFQLFAFADLFTGEASMMRNSVSILREENFGFLSVYFFWE